MDANNSSFFMPDSQQPSLKHSVLQWSIGVQNTCGSGAEEWIVHRVEHCKDENGKTHEYLRFTLRNPRDPRPLYLFAERMADKKSTTSSIAHKSTIAVPSCATTSADDQILITFDERHRQRDPMNVMDHFSPPPTVLQLSLLLKATSESQPNYNVYASQCFWFAAAVWGALKGEFGGEEKMAGTISNRSKFWNFTLVEADRLGVAVGTIRQKYRDSEAAFRVKQRETVDAKKRQEEEEKRRLIEQGRQAGFQEGWQEGRDENHREVLKLKNELASRDREIERLRGPSLSLPHPLPQVTPCR
ncbi:hypothetical protein JAAARDRAFT_56748 [Jaapia argillacea MUCL 33604]|uniref:Uncharacterized protein n=1 Tax=Jaapia argillacea MUCL 33604 TaxID=933084 RepID=A0A067QB29_9AGAM|nr:hypothetical protein JAAARDRAFT_56748 [Jaapia argillacea MUCL 33604]